MLIVIPCYTYSQDTTTVVLEKCGQLKKKLKSADYNFIKNLVISGPVGDDDVELFAFMPELTSLNLKDATLILDKSYKHQKYLQEHQLSFPIMNKLTTLILPLKSHFGLSSNYVPTLDASKLPKLKILFIGNDTGVLTTEKNCLFLDILAIILNSGNFSHEELNHQFYYERSPNSQDFFYSKNDNDQNEKFCIYNEKYRIVTKTLILSDIGLLLNKDLRDRRLSLKEVCPFFIKTINDHKLILNYWSDDLSPQLLENVDSISEYAFRNYNKESLVLPPKITTIPKFCFAHSGIKNLTIPESVNFINADAFGLSNIKKVTMLSKIAPSIDNFYSNEDGRSYMNAVDYVIPVNSLANYSIGPWKYLHVTEVGAKTDYEFYIKEPGKIDSFLTEKVMKSAESITLKGILFNSDIKKLCQCKNLRKLDISQTFILQSAKELEADAANANALASLFISMGVASQSDYNNGLKTYDDNFQIQYLAKLGEMIKKGEVKSDPNCQIPNLSDSHSLQYIIYPLQLQTIDGRGVPTSVVKVVLPQDLKVIKNGTFSECSKLKYINFPASLEKIEVRTYGYPPFKGCTSIEAVDLSETKITELDMYTFEDCYSLILFKGPQTLNKVDLSFKSKNPLNLYFYNNEAIELLFHGGGGKVHIPKGSKAGWTNILEYNPAIKLIEE